jgi:hypothetical protein
MAILAKRPFTQGNRIKYNVDYKAWLTPVGTTIVTANVSTTATGFAVDTVTHTSTVVTFYLSGTGTLNDFFTVALQITDSNGEIKNDTVEYVIVAP